MIRERPAQRYFEIFRLGAEGQSFVVAFDLQLTLSFLVVEMEDHRSSAYVYFLEMVVGSSEM